MRPLIELYRPMFEVAGRQLSLHDFPDDVKVAWDDFAQRIGVTSASFIERSGKIFANAKGKGWFEWDGTTWQEAEKPGPKVGPETGRFKTRDWRTDDYDLETGTWSSPQVDSLFDVFSTDFTGYRNNISRAAATLFGKDWRDVIERQYGSGSVNRIFSELWRNFWTDHEGLGEVAHFYDAARQAEEGDQAPNYNLQIGPRYDVPRNYTGAQWDYDQGIRRRRITSSDDFDQVYSSK